MTALPQFVIITTMIIVDFNALAMAVLFTEASGKTPEPNLFKHMILNSIRMYNLKFREEYGEMVIATDHRSWRKDAYKYYKAGRAKSKDESPIDFDAVFEILDRLKLDIAENFPFKIINLYGAEADDIMFVLSKHCSPEKVMIVSSDKDFIQLHSERVKQFSPYHKKELRDKDPVAYLQEQIIRGDASDGVPNILSADDTFVTEGVRQRPITKKKVLEWTSVSDPTLLMDDQIKKNYERNKLMIDLSMSPPDLQQSIINQYESQKPQNRVLNYFIKNRMKMLIECVSDFTNKSIKQNTVI